VKIALISGAHPYSGLGKYALSLFERLHSLDRNVDMLHCETPGAYLQLNHNRVKILRERFRWPYIGRTFLPMHYYFSGQIPGGYDIYHISHIGLSKVAKLRKPSVITHMDIAQFLFPQMYSFPERVWIKMLLKYYREADRIIAISESSRDELLGLGIVPSEKVTVVHLGYDEKLYKPLPKQEARQKLGLPREAKIVLNVGTEDARKDIPTLLKAVYNLQQTIPNLMLIRVGGTNPANDAIKKQIMLRQYQNIPEAELPLLYSASDVFAFPSIYEGGIAYPPLEAMACGVPTIITSALELFQGGCAMVPARSADALAAVMHQILTDPEKRRELSLSALREAKKYTLSREVDATYRVYEEVSR